MAVKANQKRLYQQIQLNTQQTTPVSVDISTEQRSDLRFAAALRYRVTTRTVSVFDDLSGINSEWLGLARLVKVERIGTRAGKPYHQIAYYISSLCVSAAKFAQGIRGHWGVENRLHWVKDVVFEEDSSRIRLGVSSCQYERLSVVRAIAILRYNGYSSITTGVRMIGHNKRADFSPDREDSARSVSQRCTESLFYSLAASSMTTEQIFSQSPVPLSPFSRAIAVLLAGRE